MRKSALLCIAHLIHKITLVGMYSHQWIREREREREWKRRKRIEEEDGNKEKAESSVT